MKEQYGVMARTMLYGWQFAKSEETGRPKLFSSHEKALRYCEDIGAKEAYIFRLVSTVQIVETITTQTFVEKALPWETK